MNYRIAKTGEIIDHATLVDWIVDCAERDLTLAEITVVIARLIEVGEYQPLVN